MMIQQIFEHGGQPASGADIEECRAAGRRLAGAISAIHPRLRRAPKFRRRQAERILARASGVSKEGRRWILENVRLLRTAEKQGVEFAAGLREFPVSVHPGGEITRVCLLAQNYLDCVHSAYQEESCTAFLSGFQEVSPLEMGELWGLKPALQCEILNRLETAASGIPDLVASLRHVGETAWKDLFESVSLVDRILADDPVAAYSRMDFSSRDRYRSSIAGLAKHSPAGERDVAAAAIQLAREAHAISDGSRAAERRSHAGYYLVDDGLPRLKKRIEYKPPIHERVRQALFAWPAAFYLSGIEILTFLTVAVFLSKVSPLTPVFGGMLLLLLPATQTAVEFMNHLVTFLLPPRPLPKLDFSEGVPPENATIVAAPCLLLNEEQVGDLVLDLEIRFLANRDPNIYFALVTDVPDADRPVEERDALVDVCACLVEGLNRRYPGSPFFLFHRHRVYNDSEGRWMGWERKRGKLLDLNQLLRGGFDAFPFKIGQLDVLPNIRYVITVDSDTQLPRDAAAKLIGTIAHPLNAAVIDPATRVVVEGYGILQPRIGVSTQSASRSRLAALYSGQTGFDIYTRAVSDAYQDLFGEGIFTGKGIYEVDAMRTVLERRFPDNALLSHDLIEGGYARVALVSDIELIEDYPSHFSSYNRRKHRWVRGDWQILRWILLRVPDYYHNLAPNPISLISRWKIVDNLRRSLLEPSLLLLLLASWLVLPGSPAYWTAAGIAVLFLPVYCDFFFALLRMPRRWHAWVGWLWDTGRAFVNGHAMAAISMTLLLHQALLSMDAIARSILRVFVTKRKLLEWETAAEAENESRSKATVDVYLEWTPVIALWLAVMIWIARPAAFSAAAPVLALWAASRGLTAWLNRAPRTMNCRLRKEDAQWLQSHGEKMSRYFHDWSSPSTNWLIPDSVREDGAVALRLSPTNLGILLNARIAAIHFGVLSLAEFIFQTRETLRRVSALQKHRGHLLNWYDAMSMEPLSPLFVSTVDSGNLAAALWTLKQAALAWAAEPRPKRGVTPEMAEELKEIAEISESLVDEMDFRFLYNSRRKILSIGYNVETDRLEPSYYDLLASEARIAVFVSIAKGDVSQEAWFHLGRAHTLVRGDRALISWTGTMFEYLMPTLWMKHPADTIMSRSARSAVRAQWDYGMRKGVPWGISESACRGALGGEPGYEPFGIPALALDRRHSDALVVAPYASFLALMVDPAAALKNLRHMEEYGWSGRYGFYEAVDYSGGGADVIRSWMSHHEGMSLLAICNLLFDNPMQRYFHAEPQVMATELLLHERLPAAVDTEVEPELATPELAKA